MVGQIPPSNVGDAAPRVRTGDIISGKFRIERVLGQGGMGVVVAARHLQLDEMVALKFLRSQATSEPEAMARFTREARAAAKLKSEHVARVLDAAVSDEGMPYIVMEYLEGRNLGQIIEDDGRLDVSTACEYAIQACEGLAEAHARGIVHRDVKPENLFLVERSEGWRAIKILDFGISKLDVAPGASATSNIATQSLMGSPCYMSPEQLRSTATVNHRTDIWSLGATLFELLAGGTAYSSSQTLPQLIACILESPTPRLIDHRSDVPLDLSAVIGKCMAKDREDRYASIAELSLALLPFAPKRARANVERAISVTLSTVVPSSQPLTLWSDAPPSPDGGRAAKESPPIEGTLRSLTSRKVPEVADNLDTLAAPTLPVPEEKRRPRLPRIAVVAMAAGGVIALAVILGLTRGRSPSPAETEQASASAMGVTGASLLAAAPSTSPLPSPAASEIPALSNPGGGVDVASSVASAPTRATLVPGGAASAEPRRLRHPAPTHPAVASASVSATSPHLDIRMER